jgi:predicted  nucleic acid-binding Zn-ribbon protein
MLIDTFRNFVEIEGLKAKILIHRSNIASQNKRISDMVSKRAEREAQIANCEFEIKNLKIKDLEAQMSIYDSSLKKFQTQMDMVKNEKELNSLNHEISSIKVLIENLETLYFESSEKVETLNHKISECREFLKGSIDSLNEISSEAKAIISKEENEIQNFQMRIDAILENEKPTHKKLYQEMEIKFKTTGPCSFINHKNCSACRINIDSVTVGNVENARSLEFCPSCGRILLPNDLNLY